MTTGTGVAPTKGSRIYIGGTTEFNDASGYNGETWTEIEDVEDLGEVGDNSELVSFAAVNDGRRRKFKGVKDAGDMALVLGYNGGDAGQIALRAAEAQPFNYNFRIDMTDQSAGSPANPTRLYFRAKVMSATFRMGTVGDVVRSGVQLAVDSAIVQVAPV